MKWKHKIELEPYWDKFEVITWPESQCYMDLPGFQENSQLIQNNSLLNDYGSSAYLVRVAWLKMVGE